MTLKTYTLWPIVNKTWQTSSPKQNDVISVHYSLILKSAIADVLRQFHDVLLANR
jgi:hypothetical protein